MSKGIIYVMSTVVPGLIKIGKTGIDSFESRMYQLERNGYNNVVGLKREFLMNAIIHRDCFWGNAPIKFYEYKKNRIEISNPRGLFG